MKPCDIDNTKVALGRVKKSAINPDVSSVTVNYETNKGRLYVDLKSVRMLGFKESKANYMEVKIAACKRTRRSLINLETKLIDLVKEQEGLLSSELRGDNIDEYVNSVVQLDRKHGKHIALRCSLLDGTSSGGMTEADIGAFVGQYVDLQVRVACVKVLKNRIYVVFDIITLGNAVEVPEEVVQEATNKFVDEEQDDGQECDHEELVMEVYIDLVEKLKDKLEHVASKIAKLRDEQERLEGAIECLAVGPQSLDVLEEINANFF